ncbi:MAG: hypothetical protein K0S32_952 [Bacteroidetes bacterium]|jgi:hypothetical protein|nr:hypothetical protein [Bacteroidota bacterium]
MLFNLHQKEFIYPCENKDMKFWTRKWGISNNQLNDAIIQTGSIRSKVIRKYLEQKGVLFSFAGLFRRTKKTATQVANLFEDEEE